MATNAFRSALALLICAAACGCASHVDEPHTLEPPSILIDDDGTVFHLVGPAAMTVAPVRAAPHVGKDAEEPDSIEALAEMLRPLKLVGGYEYLAAEPDYELATRIIEERRDGPRETLVDKAIFGTSDDRVRCGDPSCNNRTEPYSRLLFSEVGCSGAMIDRGTALTAAHCVYDSDENEWLTVDGPVCSFSFENPGSNTEDRRDPWIFNTTLNCLPRWAAGVDAVDPDNVPPGPVPFGWQGCYDVTIPSGFRTAEFGSTEYWLNDYAVIDFYSGCGENPGDTVGWFGTWVAFEPLIESKAITNFGYPGIVNGIPRYEPWPGLLPPFSQGQPWGFTAQPGDWYIDTSQKPSWEILTNTVDISRGQSGGPLWVSQGSLGGTFSPPSSGSLYIVGHFHWEECFPPGACPAEPSDFPIPVRNAARRFTSTVYNFIEANSAFPRN